MKFKLFTTQRCPKCPEVKEFMQGLDIEGEFIDASTPEGLEEAKKFNIMNVPLVIFFDGDKEVERAGSIEEIKKVLGE